MILPAVRHGQRESIHVYITSTHAAAAAARPTVTSRFCPPGPGCDRLRIVDTASRTYGSRPWTAAFRRSQVLLTSGARRDVISPVPSSTLRVDPSDEDRHAGDDHRAQRLLRLHPDRERVRQ